LYVLSRHAATATDICTGRGAGNDAPDGGDVLAGSAADLVAEDATEDGTHQGARDVGAAAFLLHLLALDPAALSGGGQHGARRGDIRLVQPLRTAAPAVIDRHRSRRVAVLAHLRIPLHGTHRRDAV